MEPISLLERNIRQRQLALWVRITQTYEIEPSLNAQVHKWIAEGSFHLHALSKTKKTGSKPVVRRDDMPDVPHCL